MEQFEAGRYERYELGGYDYFVPSEVNHDWVWNDAELNWLLEQALVALGWLNVAGSECANLEAFIQMSTATETVASSSIEGTQTSVGELLLPEAAVAPERRADRREVEAYRWAHDWCLERIEAGPVSLEMLQKAHRALMRGVARGQYKGPGELRRAQNWIGGRTPNSAQYVPPAYDYVEPLLGDLMDFLYNDRESTPLLARVAIAHYQFESIHPFLDGNGRIGRLLITLYLQEQGLVERPLLPISRYFEDNRQLYYARLSGGREAGGLLKWVKYFVKGVAETAARVCEQAEDLERTRAEMLSDERLRYLFGRRRVSAKRLIEALFAKPNAVSVRDVRETCELSNPAAADLVKRMIDCGHLREVTGGSRGRLYSFTPYLDIFD